MSHLTALGLPESQKKRPKEVQKHINLTDSMAFHTDKDLKSKNDRGKKVFILAKIASHFTTS